MSDSLTSAARRRKLPSLAYELPSPSQVAAAKEQRSRWGPPLGLLLYAFSVFMAVDNDMFRNAEMRVAGPASGLFIGEYHVRLLGTSAFFHGGSTRGFGLDLSAECTSALLLIPLFVMMGSFMVFSALNLRRQILAALAGALLIVVVNTLRVAGIAWSTWNFGVTGYDYSHVFIGSAFSLVGFVGAMLVALWILVSSGRLSIRMPRHRRVFGGRHRAAS